MATIDKSASGRRRAARHALAALLLGVFAPLAAGAPMKAPEEWRRETFHFPLPFAPTLPYQGTEEVRFSPQWAHFSAQDGFTYAVLWEIKPAPTDGATLEHAMGTYFDGLMNNVSLTRKIDALVSPSAAVLHPLDAPAGWTDAWAGTITTWNAFSKAEPLVLNVEIARRTCDAAREQVFFALSEAPRAHRAWDALRAIRKDTGC